MREGDGCEGSVCNLKYSCWSVRNELDWMGLVCKNELEYVRVK